MVKLKALGFYSTARSNQLAALHLRNVVSDTPSMISHSILIITWSENVDSIHILGCNVDVVHITQYYDALQRSLVPFEYFGNWSSFWGEWSLPSPSTNVALNLVCMPHPPSSDRFPDQLLRLDISIS